MLVPDGKVIAMNYPSKLGVWTRSEVLPACTNADELRLVPNDAIPTSAPSHAKEPGIFRWDVICVSLSHGRKVQIKTPCPILGHQNLEFHYGYGF